MNHLFQIRVFAEAQVVLPNDHCDVPYELQRRLENLTAWQNISLSLLNNSTITEMIETLRSSILPSTEIALVSQAN